jgi:hypothetical protein
MKHLSVTGAHFNKGGVTMGYFDNLDNELLNKYPKILKIEKKFIDMLFYL